MLQIRTAARDDYARVRNFYYSLTDAMRDAVYPPGWEKDIYPTQEFLIQSIRNGELYIGGIGRETASCMVVNHAYNAGYKAVRWSIDAADTELLVIHALGVHPAYSGRGIAKQMVRHVIETARRSPVKTIRLDVLAGNVPAEQAYTKLGFVCLDTIPMYYADTGWTRYRLFEYLLND